MADELLTAAKVAAKIGASPAKVKKFIEENRIEPDKQKGNCKYYGPKTVKKIEKGV